MKRDPDSYQSANLWLGVFLFLFSRRRFLEMACEHHAWINLQAPDLRAAYVSGSFDPCSDEGKNEERDRFSKLRAHFLNSLIQMVVIAAIALVFGAVVGVVGISLSLHLGHLLGFVGTFLIAWAALFELGGPQATWDGITACELIHPKLFRGIFLPGALATLFAILL